MILLTIPLFYRSLNITVYVVLQMNVLNPISRIENNIFQSMVMIPIFLQ